MVLWPRMLSTGITLPFFYSNPFAGLEEEHRQALTKWLPCSFRYVMPESHAEVYGEYGFDDNRYDLEDMLVSPEHSRAYLIGFTKSIPKRKTRLSWSLPMK